MEFTTAMLWQLVGRASYLEERLSPAYTGTESPQSPESVEAYLKQWRTLLGDSDGQILAKRLAWDGLDMQKVCYALAGLCSPVPTPDKLPGKPPLPEWAIWLQEILHHLPYTGLAKLEPITVANRPVDWPVPFHQLWSHIVRFASEQLRTRCPHGWALLAPAARANLQTGLLQLLGRIGNLTLQLEFSLFRSLEQSFPIRSEASTAPSRKLYRRFIEQLLAGRFLELLNEYCVLGRLLAQAVGDWVTHHQAFLQRLQEDWPMLQRTFSLSGPCRVVNLAPYLSDMHHHGQAVIALLCADGTKLLYKPRHMAMEKAYYQMLAWWNPYLQHQWVTPFLCLTVLDRGNYGWMECAQPQPCLSTEEVHHYYYRAGMHLCLLHLLRGRDFHLENIIAAGPHPLLVDLESLFHPELPENGPQNESTPAHLSDSVLRTDLLPQLAFDFFTMNFDVSGLAAAPGQHTPFRVPRWTAINSDQMALHYIPFVLGGYLNRPCCQGQVPNPGDYVEDVSAGFSAMAQLVQTHQHRFLAPDGPFSYFQHLVSRFLFRPSKVYGALFHQCVQPDHLRQGVMLSIQLEQLYKSALRYKERPTWWSLLQEEKDAVARLCVPHFTVFTSSLHVYSGVRSFTAGLTRTTYDTALEKIKEFRESESETQVRIIYQALAPSSRTLATGINAPTTHHPLMEVIP